MDPKDLPINHAEKWLSDHGSPSADDLQTLASHNSLRSLETLRELADSYNISYDNTTSPQELVDRISLAQSQEASS